MLIKDSVESSFIKREENYLKNGIKKYLQPLMYELDIPYLKATNVIALWMPSAWKEITLALFFDSKKKWKLSDLLKDLCRKYPFILTYYLDDASYKGKEPFLFFDQTKFSDEMLEEVSLELASLLKEYNQEYGWGIDNQILNSFYLNNHYDQVSLYEILMKDYKYAVYSGYFISNLCKNRFNAEVDLYYSEYEMDEKTGKKKRIQVPYKKTVNLNFQHSSNGGKAHEANSQVINLGAGYFSYVLEMNLLVTPMETDRVFMNLKPSIRQWITLDGITEYKFMKEQPSIFFGERKQENGKSYLVHTSFARVKNEESNEPKYKLPKVLNDFLNRYQISFRDVLHNTKKYVSTQEIFIGIPFKQSTASWWENYRSFDLTGNGITVEEGRMFYREVCTQLDGLKIVDSLLDISNRSSRILKKEKTEILLFSHMVIPNHIDELNINVFAAEEKFFQEFVEHFLSRVKEKNGALVFLNIQSGARVMVSFFNKRIGFNFWYKEIKKSHLLMDDHKTKLKEVYEEIDSLLIKNQVNLNLFFIPDYQNHKEDSKRDPIEMVRHGFRQLGQSVQFINYRYLEQQAKIYFPNREIEKPKNKLHRFRSAFLDSLSKIGIHQQVEIKWEEEFVQIGLDLIKLDNKREYYCMTKQENEDVFIKVIGQTRWYKYSDYPVFWEDMLQSPLPKEDRQQWVIDGLSAELRKEHRHVLLTISAGIRQKVPCLRNDQISPNIPFSKLGNVTLIRTCDWKEVPDYYTRRIRNDKWENSQAEGLFQFNNYISYSLADRGDQFFSQLGKSRIDEEDKEYYKKKKLIELLIFKSNETKLSNQEILQYIHTTRKQNISFNSYTNEPQILYYIKQIVDEYKK